MSDPFSFDDYVKLATRTESRLQVDDALRLLACDRILHGAIGLVTETGELVESLYPLRLGMPADQVNITEEVGDLFWYMAVICDCLEIKLAEIDHGGEVLSCATPRDRVDSLVSTLIVAVARLHDSIKRYVYYSTSLDRKNVVSQLATIFVAASRLVEYFGGSVNAALDRNIAKLEKRFSGNSFTHREAVSRDLVAEREALESQPQEAADGCDAACH